MLYAGVDIGGTNIKVALIEIGKGDPKVLSKTSFPFAKAPCDALCENIAISIRQLLFRDGKDIPDLKGIGLTVPGSIDQAGEVLLHAYNMGYHNVPVKAELQKHFPDTHINMINDAKAAALAELKAGAFKGKKNALLLTLGTGLGTGLILDGKVFNGGCNRGSEIGHLPFKYGADHCTCGMDGCMEVYTSATWIAKQGRDRLGENFADAKAVKDAAAAGDLVAREIFDEYTDNLATAIAGLCNVFDPEIVALGGGLSAAGDMLYEPLKKLVAQRNFFKNEYEIVPAKTLNDAGVIGAAISAV